MDQNDLVGNTEAEFFFYYTVTDVTGSESLSTYSLDATPLTFVPEESENWPGEYSNKRIVWDFGDGTRVESITGRHTYSTPGQYRVRSYVYNNQGESFRNSRSVLVDIKDIVTDKILIDIDRTLCGIEHLTSEVTNPIQVTQFNSRRAFEEYGQLPPVVTYIQPNSFTTDYGYFTTGLNNATYGHLIPTYKFVQDIQGVETVPISAVQINNYDNIYAYVSSGNILTSTNQVPGSEFAGVSSSNTVFFVSDIPGLYNLFFGFEQGSIFKDVNTTTYGTSAKICDNLAYDYLGITSNGIDGESIPIDTFNINEVKFSCTKIPFVVQIKDNDGYSQRSLPLLELDPLLGYCIQTESLSSSIIGENFEYQLNTEDSAHIPIKLRLTDKYNTTYPALFTTNFNDLSSILVPGYFPGYAGGFFKGHFIIDSEDKIMEDVWIEATTTYDNFPLSGESNKFSIYPKDHYVVAKHGEDVNFEEIFQDITTQPLFDNTKILINDFLTSIFGNIESAQNSIGKSTYEKIQNFADNHTSIDYSNINQLASILESYNLPKINKYTTPPNVRRLLDILSISMARLFGDKNQNTEDYASYGYIDNACYGKNRCSAIPDDGVVFAGHDIVAFEKFSGKWVTLNTMLPLCASSPPQLKSWYLDPVEGIDYENCFKFAECNPIITESSISAIELEGEYFNLCLEGEYDYNGVFSSYTQYYQLSDYNESWGWPLILDKDGTLFDVYKFYYKTSYENDKLENSVINFEDGNNTINKNYTYSEWSRPNGVMSNIFANSLYDGLGLFTCEESGPIFLYLRPDGISWYIRYYDTAPSCYIEANPPADNSIYVRPFN
jgi:hypothetical protein